jgi:LmbE family N-acetylglucosaminyl deacetylase
MKRSASGYEPTGTRGEMGTNDGDRLLLAGSLVVSGDPHDTVGLHRRGEREASARGFEKRWKRMTYVNLEGNLDLGDTSRGGRDRGQLELSEVVVVLGERSLALVDLDEDGGLVVG